jgi:hypothetical protein
VGCVRNSSAADMPRFFVARAGQLRLLTDCSLCFLFVDRSIVVFRSTLSFPVGFPSTAATSPRVVHMHRNTASRRSIVLTRATVDNRKFERAAVTVLPGGSCPFLPRLPRAHSLLFDRGRVQSASAQTRGPSTRRPFVDPPPSTQAEVSKERRRQRRSCDFTTQRVYRLFLLSIHLDATSYERAVRPLRHRCPSAFSPSRRGSTPQLLLSS